MKDDKKNNKLSKITNAYIMSKLISDALDLPKEKVRKALFGIITKKV